MRGNNKGVRVYRCAICGWEYPEDELEFYNGKPICWICLQSKKKNVDLRLWLGR